LTFVGTILAFISITSLFTDNIVLFTVAFSYTNIIVKSFYLQIKIQAISKTVNIRQIQLVKIITSYIACIVDDTLRKMHNEKVNVVNFITGDLNIDDTYNDITYVNKFIKTYKATKVHK
jgi:hypothetical protein